MRVWFVRILIALLVAASITIAGVVFVNLGIDSELGKFKEVNVKVAGEPPEAHAGNFLLIGSDVRPKNESAADASAFGDSTTQTGQRSDTIMVVHVDPSTQHILLVSFPRDLLVNIPGVGMSKINAAYNYGPQKIIDTIKSNFNVDINHYLEVDFRSFQGIVDALGGVTLFFPAPARDTVTGLSILLVPSGGACEKLGGNSALAFVRSRHFEQYIGGKWRSDPSADIGRIKRQQDFLRKIASESARQAVGSFSQASKIANRALSKGLTKDTELTRGDILGLIGAFLHINPADPSQLESQTFPWRVGPNFQGQSVLYPKDSDAAPLLARLRTFGAPTTPTAASKVLPSTVQVRVLNGTRRGGLAGTTLSALQQAGFSPAGVGDAKTSGTTTEIRYRTGAEDQARLVQSYLGGVGTLIADPSIAAADVVVVLRSDFQAVSAPGLATTAPTTAAKTTTTAKPATPSKTTAAPTAASC